MGIYEDLVSFPLWGDLHAGKVLGEKLKQGFLKTYYAYLRIDDKDYTEIPVGFFERFKVKSLKCRTCKRERAFIPGDIRRGFFKRIYPIKSIDNLEEIKEMSENFKGRGNEMWMVRPPEYIWRIFGHCNVYHDHIESISAQFNEYEASLAELEAESEIFY